MQSEIEAFEEVFSFILPKHKVVCPRCRGNGTHVNPAVDGHGISAEEMDELGEDFRDDYINGVYNIPCEECNGANVVDEVNEEGMNPYTLKDWHEWLQSAAESRAIEHQERMMGA